MQPVPHDGHNGRTCERRESKRVKEETQIAESVEMQQQESEVGIMDQSEGGTET